MIETKSSLSDDYETIVSETVPRWLELSKRDAIRYTICPGGVVIITRATNSEVNAEGARLETAAAEEALQALRSAVSDGFASGPSLSGDEVFGRLEAKYKPSETTLSDMKPFILANLS